MPDSVTPRRARWPRAVRLTRGDDIRATIQYGQRAHGGWFRLFFRPDHAVPMRFAISIRKNVGNACTRNRERRRVKESLRLSRRHWPPNGYGVLVVDRPDPEGLSGLKRNEIVAGLLEKIQETTNRPGK